MNALFSNYQPATLHAQSENVGNLAGMGGKIVNANCKFNRDANLLHTRVLTAKHLISSTMMANGPPTRTHILRECFVLPLPLQPTKQPSFHTLFTTHYIYMMLFAFYYSKYAIFLPFHKVP